jgi:hypothetical protein
MTIKTSSAKAKGRNLQKYIRDRIYATWDQLRPGDVESRSMGASGVDIMLSPFAEDVCPLAIEAKATRKTPSMAEIKQAQANAERKTLPVVAWKPHGARYEDTLVMCSLEDLLEWLHEH